MDAGFTQTAVVQRGIHGLTEYTLDESILMNNWKPLLPRRGSGMRQPQQKRRETSKPCSAVTPCTLNPLASLL